MSTPESDEILGKEIREILQLSESPVTNIQLAKITQRIAGEMSVEGLQSVISPRARKSRPPSIDAATGKEIPEDEEEEEAARLSNLVAPRGVGHRVETVIPPGSQNRYPQKTLSREEREKQMPPPNNTRLSTLIVPTTLEDSPLAAQASTALGAEVYVTSNIPPKKFQRFSVLREEDELQFEVRVSYPSVDPDQETSFLTTPGSFSAIKARSSLPNHEEQLTQRILEEIEVVEMAPPAWLEKFLENFKEL